MVATAVENAAAAEKKKWLARSNQVQTTLHVLMVMKIAKTNLPAASYETRHAIG